MSKYAHGIEVGDKVEILIGAGDEARYGMTREMEEAKGVIAEVLSSFDNDVRVRLPGHRFAPQYHKSEVKKVETSKEVKFLPGQRVKIVTGGAFGSNSTMEEAYGGYGEVVYVLPDEMGRKQKIMVKSEDGHGTWGYAPHELQHETAVKLRGFKADTVIVDDPAAEHIQSHDELVAENESLEKQIRKLEARVERKKEFQRQNVRKIAAWQVILEE